MSERSIGELVTPIVDGLAANFDKRHPLWHHTANLAGQKPPIHVNEPWPGFYKIRKRGPRKSQKITDRKPLPEPFVPASIFIGKGAKLECEIDGEPRDPVNEWTYLVKHPISEEDYRYYQEHGRWADDPVPTVHIDEETRHGVGGNSPPEPFAVEDDSPADVVAEPEASPYPELDALIGQVEETKQAAREVYKLLTADAPKSVCERAQNIRDRLKTLSRQIDDLRKKVKQPWLDGERAVDEFFRDPIAHPLDVEKKLAPLVTAWLKADRDRRQREADEEARRLAEEQERGRKLLAEAAGHQPAAEPEVIKPAAVKVEAAKIGGGYSGRRSSLRTIVSAKITDPDALYQHVKQFPEVREVMQSLANRLIKIGPVPGVEKDEREAA